MPFMTNFQNVLSSVKKKSVLVYPKMLVTHLLISCKALLHLLLKISESLTRLETMLLIASPDDEVKGSMDITTSNFLNYTTQGEDNPDEK